MKYALESLPSLLGDVELNALVRALGVENDYQLVKEDKPDDVGRWLAYKIFRMADPEAEKQIYEGVGAV